MANTQTGVRQTLKSHHPTDDPRQRALLLRQRFSELGPIALQFTEERTVVRLKMQLAFSRQLTDIVFGSSRRVQYATQFALGSI